MDTLINLPIDIPGADYAFDILLQDQKFINFAIAMLDYMGEDYPHSKSLYSQIRASLSQYDMKFEFDDEYILSLYSDEDIKHEFHTYKLRQENEEQKSAQGFKENIDELQFLLKGYRSSEGFKTMLNFVGRFCYLAPYNAMIVHLQKPGAQFVFSIKDWHHYNRRPKPNAQNLITLCPFGPIQLMYDFGDTEPINERKSVSESELMEQWYSGLMKTNGTVNPNILSLLLHNLNSYGIYLDDSFSAANTYGGYIQEYSQKKLLIQPKIGHRILVDSRFIITINKNQNDVQKFHTICHELGHLFCYHQSYNHKKIRHLSVKEMEFEAETVAWLVCKRHRIDNPSEEYLALYAPNGEIPLCNIEIIMKAVTEIEKMITKKVLIQNTLWFKEDRAFSEFIRYYLRKNH